MDIDRIVFYSHYGNGDIFESRDFVKWWMRTTECESYAYAHGKDKRILLDMPELEYMEVNEDMPMRQPYAAKGGVLYINTWIGRDGRYVLPNIGCVVEKLFDMHSDIAESLGLPRLEGIPSDYIPKIDFSYYETDKIDWFVNDVRKFVIISNGNVQSNQAYNFDFNPIIQQLCHDFTHTYFVVTNPTTFKEYNLLYTGDIIGDVGLDLNEIAYLSLFTDLTVGRNSAPHVFTQNRDNWYDNTKVSLSFTYGKEASHFVHSDRLPMKKLWSGAQDFIGVYNKIADTLERIGEKRNE